MITKIIQFFYNRITFSIGFMRTLFWKMFFKNIWKNTYIMGGWTFYSPRGISLWNNVFINLNAILDGKGTITIWNDVSLWPNVRIWSFNHNTQRVDIPMNIQWNITKAVTIGNDVWIWDGAIILPGVRIGNWVVVWAGSIVTEDIEDYSIAVWNPARVVKKRK